MIHRLITLLAITLSLSLPSGVLAQGGPPEGKGPGHGKATSEGMRQRDQRDDEDEQERAEGDREHAEEQSERARETSREERERMEQERERNRDENDAERRGPNEMPPGLEKRDQPPGAGKGSETGQQQRQENARPWWRFWGEE